jgi:peptide/nickel transport system substrate-binding protein
MPPLHRRDVLRLGAAGSLCAALSACLGGDGEDDAQGRQANATATATEAPTAPAATASPTEAATSTALPTDTPVPVVAEGRTLRFLAISKISCLNAHLGGPITDLTFGRMCLEPLAEFGPDGSPILLLAAEWPTLENGLLAADGLSVTWPLREGVRFHDGTPLSAHDVAFTWEFRQSVPILIERPEEAYAPIDAVEALDDLTVRITFAMPNPNWIDVFTGMRGVILPEHVYRPLLDDAPLDAYSFVQVPENLTPIGTGPWRAVSFDPVVGVLFEANDDYWDGPPNFDAAEFDFQTGGTEEAVARVRDGDADLHWVFGGGGSLESDGDVRIVTAPGVSIERLFFNFSDWRGSGDLPLNERPPHPYLSDERVRRAIAMAVDRDRMAADAFGHEGEPADYLFPGPFRGAHQFPGFDLDAARALVKEAGAAGQPLRLQSSSAPAREAALGILAEALEALGFVVETELLDAGVFFSRDRRATESYISFAADLQLFSEGSESLVPVEWARRFRSDEVDGGPTDPGVNFSGFADPAFDALHDRALATADPDEQMRIWDEIGVLLTEQVVEVPIVQRAMVFAMNPALEGWNPSPWAANPTWNMHTWTVGE